MIKNSVYLLGAETVARLLSVVVTAVLARRLGVEDFGTFSLAMAVAWLAGIGMDFGLNFHDVREIAQDADRIPEIIGKTLLIKAILSAAISFATRATIILFLLNSLLIPRFGMLGAASAELSAMTLLALAQDACFTRMHEIFI